MSKLFKSEAFEATMTYLVERLVPEVVHFRITARCNNNCTYCYGIKNMKDLPLSELQRIFDELKGKGIKGINLCGGEPTIREDFGDIIKELKNRDFEAFLDTNGDFFPKYADLITNNFARIGLPIDFSDPNRTYRNKKNLENVLGVLDYYKNKDKRPHIKVGTVATRATLNNLEDVGNLLTKHPVDLWKIYEFIPSGTVAKQNVASLGISHEDYERAADKVLKSFSGLLNIVLARRSDRTRAYFLMNPDGSVFVPVDDSGICTEVVIGHVFDKDIFDKWREFASGENYAKNTKITFGRDVTTMSNS